MIWLGVGEKSKKLQNEIVLHLYPLPITDHTHLLKVSVFLCFLEYELILSASFEQYVCYSLLQILYKLF